VSCIIIIKYYIPSDPIDTIISLLIQLVNRH